jgi:hypothetical protein
VTADSPQVEMAFGAAVYDSAIERAVAEVAAIDPAWGRLTTHQACGLSCAGCGRSLLESERVAGGWIGPLDAVPAGRSPIAGFELRICQDCADATDHCEEDGWQTAREFDGTDEDRPEDGWQGGR